MEEGEKFSESSSSGDEKVSAPFFSDQKKGKKQFGVYLEVDLMERWRALHPTESFTLWVRNTVEADCDELESQQRGAV